MNTLGKISLILSVFCLLVTLGFRLALSGWIPFIGWGFGFGLFFFIFAWAINYRFVLGLLKSESLHFLTKSLVLIVLVFAILFVLNFILFKKNPTLDLTENKIHSLSKLTQALLKALPEELTFHYFHVDNDKVRGFEPKVREFLQPFQNISALVKYQSHSVYKEPDLAKKFKTGNEESTLFVEFKGRIGRVASLTEASVTNAVLKITKKPKKMYFLTNHDERRPEDESTFGIKGIADQLERLHYQVESLDSLDSIPEDVAMLVIVGPRKPVTGPEQEQLTAFLAAGGALFVALDPGEDHGLESFLLNYGVEFENTFVFSAEAQAGQSELLVLTHAGNLSHPIPQSLMEGENPVLFISSSLKLNDSSDTRRISPILEHIPNSLGRADVSPESAVVNEGRQVAAAISEGLGSRPDRLVVVADSDFITNQFYAQPSNFNFLLGVVTYLAQDEDLLKMRPPRPKTTYLIMTDTQMNLYFLFFILPYCALFFVLALFFKLRRYF